MTEMNLCEAIADFVAGELAQVSWELPNGTFKQFEPKKYIGFYPPKRSKQDDDNPYIFVVPQNGSTTSYNEQSTTVVIYIGTRSESLTGYTYLFEALERVRHALMSAEGNIINHVTGTYQMQLPFSWEYESEQPYPFWGLKLTTQWAMPVIQQESSFE